MQMSSGSILDLRSSARSMGAKN